MKNLKASAKEIVRFISISGFIIALAYLIYRDNVFTSTMWAFQYFVSSITIGIAYVTFKEKNFREGIALLLFWYIILVMSVSSENRDVFILEGVYAGITALAVYWYIITISKSFIKNEISRIIMAIIIIGLSNCLIVVILDLYGLQSIYSPFSETLNKMFFNFKIGATIGLFMGTGIELSNYLVDVVFKEKKLES